MPLPIIGSKYTGPNDFVDTQSGTYWQVMPKLSADEEKLQKALLKKPRNIPIEIDFCYSYALPGNSNA